MEKYMNVSIIKSEEVGIENFNNNALNGTLHPIDKILESTANVVESIGRNSGSEYDNLTAAILEMNNNSILKDKMNKTAKIIITVLSLLLLASIVLNVLYSIDCCTQKGTVDNKGFVRFEENVHRCNSDTLNQPADSITNR